MRSLREPKALTTQPMRCRSDQNMAEILSKRPQQNSFQVVHFTSARRFDHGQPGKETEAVVTALSQRVRKLPATLRRSLTWDRGPEMAKHKEFTVAIDVQVYFCDPQSPWQRRTNENTNLLLRPYFPRGTDLSPISQAQLDQVCLGASGSFCVARYLASIHILESQL